MFAADMASHAEGPPHSRAPTGTARQSAGTLQLEAASRARSRCSSSGALAAAAPLAERYTALRKAANEAAAREGRVSTCEVILEPAVGCAAGYCRTIPGAPSGRAD